MAFRNWGRGCRGGDGATILSGWFAEDDPVLLDHDGAGSDSSGQCFSVARNSWRTSLILSVRSSTVQSATDTGGNTAMSTVPATIVPALRPATRSAFRSTMGTIGMPAAMAI